MNEVDTVYTVVVDTAVLAILLDVVVNGICVVIAINTFDDTDAGVTVLQLNVSVVGDAFVVAVFADVLANVVVVDTIPRCRELYYCVVNVTVTVDTVVSDAVVVDAILPICQTIAVDDFLIVTGAIVAINAIAVFVAIDAVGFDDVIHAFFCCYSRG
ncbi:hypothetical protein NDU88_003856 [Pleurodeles waltl]|uniref:Uncharacterized protein n=1 Tax=Pleurodeles waltl TaxID=8319 RepID=A0AAV7KW66_PLEWA|nr:hypothetical protein NDU88_003856 [Pleurodeles waltl]